MYGPGLAMTHSPASLAAAKNGSRSFQLSKSSTPGAGLCIPQKVYIEMALKPSALIRCITPALYLGVRMRQATSDQLHPARSDKSDVEPTMDFTTPQCDPLSQDEQAVAIPLNQVSQIRRFDLGRWLKPGEWCLLPSYQQA